MLDIEWTATSYTIDNLEDALYQTEQFLKSKTDLDLDVFYAKMLTEIDDNIDSGPFTTLWTEAEHYFSRIAFEGWMSYPDNCSLVCC